MIDNKSREMTATRLEVAIGICLRFPTLFNKVMSKQQINITEEEYPAAKILVDLLNLEPVVRHVLTFYYKRELR